MTRDQLIRLARSIRLASYDVSGPKWGHTDFTRMAAEHLGYPDSIVEAAADDCYFAVEEPMSATRYALLLDCALQGQGDV